MYDAVLRAQLAAIGKVRPGVGVSVVDAAARETLDRAGFGQFFTHSTGHGVGLEVHELPSMGRIGHDLLPGDVVTVEPGLYRSGYGGLSLYDLVLVTPDGHEVITDYPYELEP